MTRHLTPDQLIDLAEGARPESSAPHLESWAALLHLDGEAARQFVREAPVAEAREQGGY